MTKREKGAELYILKLISNSSLKDKFFSNAGDVQVMKWYAHFFASYNPKTQKEQKALYMKKIVEYQQSCNQYAKEKGELLMKLSKCPKFDFDRTLTEEVLRFKNMYVEQSDKTFIKFKTVFIEKKYTCAVFNEYRMKYEPVVNLDRDYSFLEIENICQEDNKRFIQAIKNNTLEKFCPTRI